MKGSPFEWLAGVSRIVMAAGHGSTDTGAVHGPHREREQTIRIVNRMADLLLSAGMGEHVVIAPHQHDTHQTIPWLNQNFGRDAWALEIHRDSADTITEPAASLRCGVYHGFSCGSTAVAQHVAASLRLAGADLSTWARPHTESRHGSLGWIRQTAAPAHLIELGFMEGRNDAAHLDHLAWMAATAVLEAFAGRTLPRPS